MKYLTTYGLFFPNRCKLFYKKDEGWAERGVGNLFLKPCGEKTQLLIRADTSIGNLGYVQLFVELINLHYDYS